MSYSVSTATTPTTRSAIIPANGSLRTFEDALPFLGEGEIVIAMDKGPAMYIKIGTELKRV